MNSINITILNSLINFNEPIDELKAQVKSLPWDSDESVELTDSILANILERFLVGKITSSKLEEWANLVESREAIVLSDKAKEAIYKLANLVLEGELAQENISELKRNL